MKDYNILDFFENNKFIEALDSEKKYLFYGSEIELVNFHYKKRKLDSVIFHINNDNSFIEHLNNDFGLPVVGLESFLKQNSSEDFHFGKVSGENFIYDEEKSDTYIQLVWKSKSSIIQYFKNNSEFNPENQIRFEISSIDALIQQSGAS